MDRKRNLSRRGAVLLLAALFLAELSAVPHLLRPGSNSDFAAYYLAARALNEGRSPYDESYAAAAAAREGIHRTRYVYPPPLASALRPLARLDYRRAASIWKGLSIVSLFVATLLLAFIARVPRWMRLVLMPLSLLVPAVHTTIEIGQVNTMLLLALSGAAILMLRGGMTCDVAAGALVGGAAAVKVFLPLPVAAMLLFARRWVAFGATAATVVVLLLLGTAHIAHVREWMVTLSTAGMAPDVYLAENQSLTAALDRLCTPGSYSSFRFGHAQQIEVPALLDCGRSGRLIGLTAGFVILAWTLWVAATARGQEQTLVALALAVTAALVAVPVVWDHYYTLLLLPVAVSWRNRRQLPMTTVAVAAVLIMLQRYWTFAVYLRSPLVLLSGCGGSLLLWGALASWTRRTHRRELQHCTSDNTSA